MIRVSCCGKEAVLRDGSSYLDAAAAFSDSFDRDVYLAYNRNDSAVYELFDEVRDGADIRFLTYSDEGGKRAYKRTACLMLLKAIHEELGNIENVNVEFSYGGNYFVRFKGHKPQGKFCQKIKERMEAYREHDIPVEKHFTDVCDAVKFLSENGFEKAAHNLDYCINPKINYYSMGGFHEYFTGELCVSAGCIRNFDLVPFEDGLLLVFPKMGDLSSLCDVKPAGPLFRAQSNGQTWAENIGIESLADLNDAVCLGKADNLILMQEAIFEKKIGDVAMTIARKKIKFVFLAGPSSSGKTTTAYRLAIQIRAYGLDPQIISADNYFFGGDDKPRLPDGKYDLESIRAVDTELFNSDMTRLLNGETVEIPTYDFTKQQREYKGKKISLSEEKVLIVEGIHCLNPLFSEKIPEENKFRIYVSALTPLSVDALNPIPTSECRLLRRIIRDNRTRGFTAAQTISQWGEVRKGEEENIYPYQDNADVVINSALIYELSVIKGYVEPLLFGIGRGEAEYPEARRLLKFLSFVLTLPSDIVPRNSLIREFIGGSCINE